MDGKVGDGKGDSSSPFRLNLEDASEDSEDAEDIDDGRRRLDKFGSMIS